MARTATLRELMDRIRELGELNSTLYVSDTALRIEINQSIAELYDKLVAADEDYFESTQSVSVVSGTASYALPSDYYKTVGVDVARADGTSINLRRYNRSERNALMVTGGVNREWTMYRIRGSNIIFVPEPNWSATVTHYYIPAPTKLTSETDTFDGISGWEDWVVYDCIIKFVGGKEESDVTVFERALARLNFRIEQMSANRDHGEPDRIRNIDEEERQRMWPIYGNP